MTCLLLVLRRIYVYIMITEEDLDQWLEITLDCKYLPENELKVRLTLHY